MSENGHEQTLKAKKMTDKFDSYSSVLTALVAEAVQCAPESWDRGLLLIDCDGKRINYKLKNETSIDKASISQQLRQLCEQYWTVFADHGEPWNEAIVDFWREDGQWKFKMNLKRPAIAPAPSKPRWKFWN